MAIYLGTNKVDGSIFVPSTLNNLLDGCNNSIHMLDTDSLGNNAAAFGLDTIASDDGQLVFGIANIAGSGYLEIVGNGVAVIRNVWDANQETLTVYLSDGTSYTVDDAEASDITTEAVRSNARTLDRNGNEVLSGKLTIGVNPTNDMDVTTKQYVDNIAANKQKTITISTSEPTSSSGLDGDIWLVYSD